MSSSIECGRPSGMYQLARMVPAPLVWMYQYQPLLFWSGTTGTVHVWTVGAGVAVGVWPLGGVAVGTGVGSGVGVLTTSGVGEGNGVEATTVAGTAVSCGWKKVASACR